MANKESKDKSGRNRREIGKLTLEIDENQIRSIVEDGRLLELADTMARQAASQISAQIVERVAEAAISGGLSSGVSASAVYIFEGGDFGTVPPLPRWGVVNLEHFADNPLQRFAAPMATTA